MHFWSIKGVYFLQNANNLNFKLFFRLYTKPTTQVFCLYLTIVMIFLTIMTLLHPWTSCPQGCNNVTFEFSLLGPLFLQSISARFKGFQVHSLSFVVGWPGLQFVPLECFSPSISTNSFRTTSPSSESFINNIQSVPVVESPSEPTSLISRWLRACKNAYFATSV